MQYWKLRAALARMTLGLASATALAAFLVPADATAINFSAIVPKEVTISTSALSGGSNGWGWFAATTDSIQLSDVVNSWQTPATFTPLGNAGGTAPNRISTGVNNEHTWTANGGLKPGQIAGTVNSFNDPLYSDIALKTPEFNMSSIQAFITFENGPPKPTGDWFLDAVIKLGNVELPYTVLVHFSATESSHVDSAQLITAIPEPATAGLLALGMAGIGVAGRRRSA